MLTFLGTLIFPEAKSVAASVSVRKKYRIQKFKIWFRIKLELLSQIFWWRLTPYDTFSFSQKLYYIKNFDNFPRISPAVIQILEWYIFKLILFDVAWFGINLQKRYNLLLKVWDTLQQPLFKLFNKYYQGLILFPSYLDRIKLKVKLINCTLSLQVTLLLSSTSVLLNFYMNWVSNFG